jgi:hypothetical protein
VLTVAESLDSASKRPALQQGDIKDNLNLNKKTGNYIRSFF